VTHHEVVEAADRDQVEVDRLAPSKQIARRAGSSSSCGRTLTTTRRSIVRTLLLRARELLRATELS
jgi:hypothetical protein